MTGSGPLGRDSMSFQDTMKRLHGEIERLVYAAEQVCTKNGAYWNCPQRCPFEREAQMFNTTTKGCSLLKLRGVLGDHVEQHDAMPETSPVPPCQCAGDCGCRRHAE